ncbi:FkbM family methyltransferase [Leptothoe sp. PORK10 BA2]|uniref:FkbM family methyltransferase n=1 Tax=Leptothoe sp. PORK10 BA2 TaxID=3110254 RepID=UPI002B1F5552|nr:FkbM family methyltransferase [Leptothoe sp. PORK10 BA2]MEA5466506.1 FkbM family methyltransferase [Leptothoe sp. PORK10 BA2]
MNIFSTLLHKIRYRLATKFWQIKCAFVGDKLENFTLLDGSKLQYPLKTTIGKLLTIGNFELAELKFLMTSVNSGDVVFDIGANGGIFTVIAAKKVGENGHVYAFEPGGRELEILKRNIELNGLTNVTVVEVAVSNESGETKFAISEDGAMNSISETQHPGQKIQSWTTVPVVTLDEFVAEQKIDHINFIKVDVEGAEKLVFDGAESLLDSHEPIIIMFEATNVTSSGFGYSTKDIIYQLFNQGFEVSALEGPGKLTPISLDFSNLSQILSYNFIAIKV